MSFATHTPFPDYCHAIKLSSRKSCSHIKHFHHPEHRIKPVNENENLHGSRGYGARVGGRNSRILTNFKEPTSI
jgi:hypothetical protein